MSFSVGCGLWLRGLVFLVMAVDVALPKLAKAAGASSAMQGPAPAASLEADREDDRFEESVVRVLVSKQPVDASSPWQFEEVAHQVHLAVVLDQERLLTTAYAVADATYMEMQAFGTTKKFGLRVLFVDYEANLALMTPTDPSALKGLRPVVLGGDLKGNAKLDIYRARDAYQMVRLPATVQEVGVFEAVTSSYTLTSYRLKVQSTGLGWSEPVFQDGKMVSLTTGQDSNYVYALPMSMIRHFLEDRHNETYRGFPALGVELDSLTSPDMRSLLGATAVANGVRIAEVWENSTFASSLKVDDVLLEVGGVPVSEHGFYTHPKWGKVHLKNLLNQRYGGDKLSLLVLRKGQRLMLDGVLERFQSNSAMIPAFRYGERAPHVIFGGLLFQELTTSYLREWGQEWQKIAPAELLFLYRYANAPRAQLQRYIVMTRVLADDFNKGYSSLKNLVLKSVNGRAVKTIEDVTKALAEAPVRVDGKSYARFVFERGGGEVILAYDGLAKVHQRIAKTYEVNRKESFFDPK